MHPIARSLLFAAVLATTPAAAGDHGPQPDAETRSTILALREAAWRSWFANDRAAFVAVVPQELVALGWGGGPWQDREGTLAQMAAFARDGGRLLELEFPQDVFQQYGEVVVLYTRFRVVLQDAAGTASETRGRGTEVFVHRDGRWIHTGWHLDAVGDATPP
jgi:hypothetical protein